MSLGARDAEAAQSASLFLTLRSADLSSLDAHVPQILFLFTEPLSRTSLTCFAPFFQSPLASNTTTTTSSLSHKDSLFPTEGSVPERKDTR